MAPLPDPGVVWIDALMTVRDADGRERLLTRYERLKELGKPLETRPDAVQRFDPDIRACRQIRPLRIRSRHRGIRSTIRSRASTISIFPTPYPNLRVRAVLADIKDLTRYEALYSAGTGKRICGSEQQDRAGCRWKTGVGMRNERPRPSGRLSSANSSQPAN